jgi:transposase
MLNSLHHIYLALEPVDMRLGIDGLSARIVQQLGQTPCDGTAYVFTNRARNRIKCVAWDGNGVWLCLRRLHQGHFVWPKTASDSNAYIVSEAQWQWLISGLVTFKPPLTRTMASGLRLYF